MLTIRSGAEMADALASNLDDELKRLLIQHRDQLAEHEGHDLGELAFFVVVEAGDSFGSIRDALGFDPTASDKTLPCREWLRHHRSWTECAFILSDDGFGCVLLISARGGIDAALAALCRSSA